MIALASPVLLVAAFGVLLLMYAQASGAVHCVDGLHTPADADCTPDFGPLLVAGGVLVLSAGVLVGGIVLVVTARRRPTVITPHRWELDR